MKFIIKVAAYCRVSTDKDDQINSFENQKSYFEKYIKKNPDWELYEIYADEHVIIGTRKEKAADTWVSELVSISFLLRDKPISFKSLKIISERI